jgi:predicted transcriptional regulator
MHQFISELKANLMTITKFENGSTLRFLSIAAEILIAANTDPKGTTLEEICRNYKTPVSSQECLKNLSELRLLHHNKKKNTFKPTKRGDSFLNDYKRLQAQLI